MFGWLLMTGKKKSNGFGAKARLMMLGITTLVGSSLLSEHKAVADTKHPVRHSAVHVAVRRATHHQVASSHYHQVASSHRHQVVSSHHYSHHVASIGNHFHSRYANASWRHSALQCVPYAREVSHVELTGNAFLWWAEAAGRYARGNEPVEGAVLSFRSIGRMPLGHVAVVTDVIDSRTILVTQANWIPGTITNDVTVQDVSPNNDWTQVQEEIGDSSTWGAAYPTYGFIYDKPATSTVIADNGQGDEVAEAPVAQPVSDQAPNRSLQ
jgi:surface antigen